MSLRWIPISDNPLKSLQITDKVLVATISDLQEEALPVGDAEKLSEFKVYQRQRTHKASTSISVSPFFKGDGSYEDFTYAYFAGAFSDRFRITKGDKSAIIAERFGFGIEIEVKVTNIKTSLKGGFAAIGAAIDMGLASASYAYRIYALPPGDFYSLLPAIGQFDSDAIKKFHGLVTKLQELYQTSIKDINLVAIEYLLADAVPEEGTENAAAYYFAARRIIEGKTLKEAVTLARQSPEKYNEDAIQYLYSRSGITSIEEKPSTNSVSIALKIINE